MNQSQTNTAQGTEALGAQLHIVAPPGCWWLAPPSQQRSVPVRSAAGTVSPLPLLALQHLEAEALLFETLHKQVTKTQPPLRRPFPTSLSELLSRPAQTSG